MSTSTLTATGFTAAQLAYQIKHQDEDRSKVIVITTTLMIVLSVISVVLRLYSRRLAKLRLRVDDYSIIVALICAIGLYATAMLTVRYGAGKHVIVVGIAPLVLNLKATFALEFIYNCTHLTIKFSILYLYKYIFTLNKRRFKIAWYISLFYVVAIFILSTVILLNQCHPLEYGWYRPLGMKGNCDHIQAEAVATSAVTAVADIALLILPLPILWNLHLDLVRKLQLCAIFFLGIFAFIASLVRIYYVADAGDMLDFTYIQVNAMICSLVEPDIGIICACLATLRPLLRGRVQLVGRLQNGSREAKTLIGKLKHKLFGSRVFITSWWSDSRSTKNAKNDVELQNQSTSYRILNDDRYSSRRASLKSEGRTVDLLTFPQSILTKKVKEESHLDSSQLDKK